MALIIMQVPQYEIALVQHRLEDIDAQIEKGVKQLNWKSAGIKEFIDTIAANVLQVSTILQNVDHCVAAIDKILASWSASPLLDRRDNRKLLNLDEEQRKVEQRAVEIAQGGREISKQLLKINELFAVGKAHPSWRDYVQYINQKVSFHPLYDYN